MLVVALFIGFWVLLLPAGAAPPYGFLVVLLAEETMFGGALLALGWIRRPAALDNMHYVVLIAEAICHSLLFYFLGGLSWLGAIAFLYALMYAVVYMSARQAIGFTAFVCAWFIGISVLDATGVIPHQSYLPQGADRYKDPAFVIPTVIGFVGVASTVTFWMMFIGGEMRRQRDVAVSAYDEMARAEEDLRRLNEELEAKVRARTQVLAYRAEHDTLTGLLNRGTIARRCRDALTLARRSGGAISFIIADGDNFKQCNDEGGHHYGDQVLHLVAQAITDCSRDTDLTGRFGGDEFLMVLPDTDAEGAEEYCRRVLSTMTGGRPDWIDGLPFPSLSLGIAVYPDHGSDSDELVRAADRAMYAAKDAGGNCYRVAAAAGADEDSPQPRARRSSRRASARTS